MDTYAGKASYTQRIGAANAVTIRQGTQPIQQLSSNQIGKAHLSHQQDKDEDIVGKKQTPRKKIIKLVSGSSKMNGQNSSSQKIILNQIGS